MVGQPAQDWRAETAGQTLRKMLLMQAQLRFGPELPADLEARLAGFDSEQLTGLVGTIMTSATLPEWLATFPA